MLQKLSYIGGWIFLLAFTSVGVPRLAQAQPTVTNVAVSAQVWAASALRSTEAAFFAAPDSQPLFQEFETYRQQLADKREGRTDQAFLRFLFHRVQRDYFHEFYSYSGVDQILTQGRFNCLSATAFYALLLQEFDYRFHIMETPLHTYLLVETTRGQVLLETTDPAHGFVTSARRIKNLQQQYQHDALRALREGSTPGQFRSVLEEISLENLCGLQYYNRAIDSYNRGEYDAAVRWLTEGYAYYPSSRFVDLFARCALHLPSLPAHDVAIERYLQRRSVALATP
ncbi:hypothetical protein SAMN05421823_107268 [Catalinimonas alkaloidigena]|uniref:Transglutaminase-like superfamily protein n=1 Tax=Catalinimonas alkaloidigena TaxID=1075417 RepID=A0A1G9M5T1_9BACT|nr:hypothetical protein [Catalinimonas alkaloidigena]SDL69301.1 hypothetical protein SAMN05421823_107268 [Catalinimonas alkaloidigena]